MDVRKYSVSWAVISSGYARTTRQIARLGYDNSEYIDFAVMTNCQIFLKKWLYEFIRWKERKKKSSSSAVAYEIGWKGDQRTRTLINDLARDLLVTDHRIKSL